MIFFHWEQNCIFHTNSAYEPIPVVLWKQSLSNKMEISGKHFLLFVSEMEYRSKLKAGKAKQWLEMRFILNKNIWCILSLSKRGSTASFNVAR